VKLLGSSTKASSQDAYASALSRHRTFTRRVWKVSDVVALPMQPQTQIPTRWVGIFVTWASKKYKVSTIKVTLSVLAEGHKFADTNTVDTPIIRQLVEGVTHLQGPAGLPVGKQGMTKPLL
jgi:hypothetical protein